MILFLCLAVFFTASAVAWGIFEAMPHLEDEHANLFQARVFASGSVAAPAPPDSDAFLVPFAIVHDGIWFGKYTPGYPLVLALGVLLGAPWAVNALASALALFGAFLLGRDLFDADCGLLAAALGAVSPAFILLSGSLLPHPVTMAALVFFAWAFLSARRPASSHPLRYAVLAGFALGLAVLARPWTALAVALPFIGITLCDGIRAIGRNTLCPYIRIYFPLVAVCLTVCSLLPLYNYAVTGSPFTNTYTLWWAYDTVGFGPGIGRGDGHSPALALLNAGLDLAAFQTALTGWPAPGGFPLVVLPLAAGLLFAPRGRRDLLLLLPPLALILAHLAYWARAGEFFGGRYYSEGMPFLWLLAARGLLKFSAGKWRLRLVQAALPLFLLWSVAFQIEPRFLRGYGLYDISRAGSDSVSAAGLRNAVVFVRRKAWTDYAAFSWLNDPYLDGDVVFARDLGPEKNTQVMQAFPGREAYYYDPAANENPLMPAETP
ncbi:MAG: glycosyltransferase family 39 protein [Anaerolineales bacterium]|nr:glycosyltransferase family 39 protein [Anaerolineales bacterium]